MLNIHFHVGAVDASSEGEEYSYIGASSAITQVNTSRPLSKTFYERAVSFAHTEISCLRIFF